MKKYIAFILLIQLTSGACDNDDKEASNKLSGRWKWLRTCEDFPGCRHATSTDRLFVTFFGTSVNMKRDDTILFSSTYEIQNRTDQDDRTIYQIRITSSEDIWTIEVEKDTLVIIEGGHISTYARIF
jgi:hypothetical protein